MAVISTGFYDGVHLGHRLVIDTLVSQARSRGERSVIITFWPHPRTVLQNDARKLRFLTSQEEKTALLKSLGVDEVVVLPFTREFAAMTAAEYITKVLPSFDCTCLVLGYDTRLGSDHLGPQQIAELFPESVIVPAVPVGSRSEVKAATVPETRSHPRLVRGRGPAVGWEGSERSGDGFGNASLPSEAIPLTEVISSTRIRKALEDGQVDLAAEMLGRPYELKGVVVAGNQLGRTIGFPTANMQLYDPLKLIPARGVYLVEVETLGCHYRGMTNIGVRPTVSDAAVPTIETNIFDFDQMIYGLDISIRFLCRIREERKFSSKEALAAQLAADKLQCKSLYV